jgi:Fic family protein
MALVMEKVAVRKKLNLKYELPSSLTQLLEELEDLRLFASYYSLDADSLLPETEANLISRLAMYAQSPAAPPDTLELTPVIEGAKQPETAKEQWISNIQHAIDFLADKKDEPLSMALLLQAHKLLVNKMPHVQEAGFLRVEGHNLFTFIEAGVLLPENDELQDYIKELFELTGNNAESAVIRAFLFFYIFTAIQPFAHENETLAILGAHHILASAKIALSGLLNLEKHIFFNPTYLVQTAHLFGEQNYLERLDTDLSAYLETCINRLRKNVREAQETLINVVKQEFEYDTLKPRQKNAINFWLEKGFFIHKEKLKTLTPRQHDIMTLMARYSYVATKDLVPVFQLDRKTIQRDFNTLLEMGLVEQRGAGRALRYHMDFKIML